MAHYIGTVIATWLDNGREMRLEADFTYVDPANLTWVSPKGAVVDGASIPRPAWPFIGGPFEGRYREASVIHDVACDQRIKPWQAVHRVFYEAMRTSGVDIVRAKIMYAAVLAGGPRWTRAIPVIGLPGTNMRQKVAQAINGNFLPGDGSGALVALPGLEDKISAENPILANFPDDTPATITFSPQSKPDLSEQDFAEIKNRITAGSLSVEDIEAQFLGP
ncbi:DUF1353 domain-containing protein [Luteibacter sp.]|jgi:hypothetical protein|uniref:DUF1353 domain-containing protein n=1 Tax=Luteibacter sp. TaxID=1886636 RepID=UPI002F3E814D